MLFYLKAVFKLLADKVQGNRIDAGVEGSHVDPNVIHHQQEAGHGKAERIFTLRPTGRSASANNGARRRHYLSSSQRLGSFWS